MAGVVDGRNVQDNALAAAESLITANPDLNAIYATGEPALLGAVAAVESQGKQEQVKVFGWDLTAPAIKGIDARLCRRRGAAGSCRHGCRRCRCSDQDLQGRAPSTDDASPVPITIVTKDNVDPYRSVFK